MRQLALLLILAVPVGVHAQTIVVQPGTRVRFTPPDTLSGRVIGTVMSRSADSIVIATPAAMQYRMALKSVPSLDVSLGKSRSAGAKTGFKWGAGIGGSIGVGFIAAREVVTIDPIAVLFVGTLAGLYGGVGAGIGAIVAGEKWARYAVPGVGSVSPSFGVTPGGVAVGGHFQFR
jgi:hypothetical protein